jgi:hypothetical protein
VVTVEKAGTDKRSASEGCKGAGDDETHERPGGLGDDRAASSEQRAPGEAGRDGGRDGENQGVSVADQHEAGSILTAREYDKCQQSHPSITTVQFCLSCKEITFTFPGSFSFQYIMNGSWALICKTLFTYLNNKDACYGLLFFL